MNWNLTENCFLTTYHSSFMVHCGPPVALLIPSLIVPPSLPDSLLLSLSLSASLQFPIDRRVAQQRIRICPSVLAVSKLMAMLSPGIRSKFWERKRNRHTGREWNDKREVRMLLFSITLFGAFWTKNEKEIRSWSTWFFWFASTVGFSLRKICFLYCRIIREFCLIL